MVLTLGTGINTLADAPPPPGTCSAILRRRHRSSYFFIETTPRFYDIIGGNYYNRTLEELGHQGLINT